MNTSEQSLVVVAAGRRVGLPAARLLGVLAASDIVALPGAPPCVVGMIAYAGAAVPVVDLGRLLDPAATAAEGPIAVLRDRRHPIACRVSAVVAMTGEQPVAFEMLHPDVLDLDAIVPKRAARPWLRPPPRPPDVAAQASVAEAEYLNFSLAGKPRFLPLREAIQVIGEATPVPVPWAAAAVPALLMVDDQAIAVVRPDQAASGGTIFVIAARSGQLVAFAVDHVSGAGPPVGRALDLSALPACPTTRQELPVPMPADAGDELAFLEFVVGHRHCLLPLNVVQAVLDDHGREALPPVFATGDVRGLRAWNAQVLPGIDLRGRLGLSCEAALARDLVLAWPGQAPFVLAVEQVVGIVPMAAAEQRRAMSRRLAAEPAIAGVAHCGDRMLWLLTPTMLAPAITGRAA